MRIINLLAILILFTLPISAHAQSTADPVLPGMLVTSGCPGGKLSCFVPYSNSNPLPVTGSSGGGGTNIIATSSATGAITPCVAGSSASSCILKASGGNLYSVYATAGSTAGYLMVFNRATLPGNGSTTAGTASGNMVECVNVAANSTTSISFNPGPPEVFSTGITAAFSSTGCATLTASATAFIKGSAL